MQIHKQGQIEFVGDLVNEAKNVIFQDLTPSRHLVAREATTIPPFQSLPAIDCRLQAFGRRALQGLSGLSTFTQLIDNLVDEPAKMLYFKT